MPPAQPINLLVVPGGQVGDALGSVFMTWSAGAGDPPAKYVIHRGQDGAPPGDPAIKTITASVPPACTDSGLNPGTYSYSVTAIGSDDKPSSPSDTCTVTLTAVKPISLNVGPFLGYLLIVAAMLALAFVLVPFPKLTVEATTLPLISGLAGAFLIRIGVVLLVAAFVLALMELLVRTFAIKFAIKSALRGGFTTDSEIVGDTASGAFVQAIAAVMAQFPQLLQRPSGFGVSAILLGVVLLVGAAFGYGGAAASPGASPTPTPTASSSAPVGGVSPSPTVRPVP